MKNFKRIVGLLLCLAMVLSFVPVTHTHVHAAEYEKIDLSVDNFVGACSTDGTQGYIDDGDFSNTNIKWYFDSTDENWGNWFDNEYTNEEHWAVDDDERADFLLDLSNGGNGTTVSRVLVSKGNYSNSSYTVPSEYYLVLELLDGNLAVEEFTTGWDFDTDAGTTYTHDFAHTYTVTKIYVWAKNCTDYVTFGQFELYQDTSATGELGATTVGTPTMKQHDISDCIVAACSSYYDSSKSNANQTWYFKESNKFHRITPIVDNDRSTGAGWSKDAGKERDDFYLDLSNSGNGTAIDQVRVIKNHDYDSDYSVPTTYQLVMVLKDGSKVTKEFSTGWSSSTTDGTEYIYNLDQTYTVTEMYVWAGNVGGTIVFGDFELWQKTTVQLPTPKNLQTTAVTSDSITVAANTVSAGGKLQFSIDGGNTWKDADGYSYTFTGLNANTEYTVLARYEATADGYVTTATPTELAVTTEETVCEHTYTDCADTTCDNGCGYERTAPGHKFTDCEDTTCNNDCGYTRAAGTHTYDNACDTECNVCGATRTVGDHVYDNACDADCNECGATRTPAEHVYDNEYDTSCEVCGHIRIIVYPEIPGLTEVEDVPAPVIGYYTDTNGTIVDYLHTDKGPASNIVDDDTTSYASSLYFKHEEVANGTKVPAILFTFNSKVNLGAIEIWGYETSRYNMEDFEVQVYVDGAWKTVTATADAFYVEGSFGDDLSGPLKLYFDQVYSTTQLRILVSGLSDMSEDADETNLNGSTNEELYTGSYIRVCEIKLYESQCQHMFDNCDDTTCNNGCGYTRNPIAHSYSDCEDTTCDNPGCDATREAPGHAYSNACDATCNNGCGHTREVPDHVYDNDCDESCNVCGEKREVTHSYDNGCDADCNDCGAVRKAEHTYDNDCDADCNICHYLRPDATGHKYDSNCDAICNNCDFERVAPHTFENCEDEECSVCHTARVPTDHVYTNECDPDCNICGFLRFVGTTHGSTHDFDELKPDCDDTCNTCGTVREAPHRYSSIYDTTCEDCGAERTAQAVPSLPVYADKEQVALNDPIFGYYSNGDTNGTITDYYVEGEGPDKLNDNICTEKGNRAQSLYYNYKEIQQGLKIPVILFKFTEPVNVCAVDIYGYAYSYYNMETFDVQVYTDGAWVNVAHVTNAFTDGEFEEQVTEALTVTFDQAYEATQLRILVRKVTNMLGRGDITSGDDVFGYSAPFRVKEIDIYSTTSEPIEYPNDMTLNGENIENYRIVYTDALDYNLRAAEYLQTIIYKKTGRTLTIVEDDTGASDYEILVGNTSRSLSTAWDAPDNQEMKFYIRTDGTKIVLEAEYFIIAGAAYYFGEKFVPTVSETEKTVPTARTALDPITEPANNYIMMIGDGMGVMQTRLFEKYGAAPTTGDYGFSDGEEIFYGYYFPSEGRSRTWNVLGQTTDSAAGGTALSTGYKTTNGTVALDWYGNEIKSLTELALELGMSASVMSTEGSDGATPAAFSTHTTGRYDDEIITQQGELEEKYANSTGQKFLFIDRYISASETPGAVYKTFTAEEWARYEAKVTNALNEMDKNENGFFIMYEEAYIDKNLHNGDIENAFKTVYRFNQAIGIFMEYAMYNPDTVVLITADHETAGLDTSFNLNTPNPPGESAYNHSTQDVPVFAYGFGTEVFATEIVDKDDLTGEVNGFYQNASIGRTFAHFMTNGHADDFGDPWYPILVEGTKEENYPYPEDPMKVTDGTLHDISISGKVTGSYSQTVSRESPATITIDLTKADGSPTNIKEMTISAANTSATPATTVVEAQVEVDGKLVWLQIYKDVLYGVMYGEPIDSGILEFHTSYNAYQIRIQINSINSSNGIGTVQLSEIKLRGYEVETPDVGGVITDGGDENEDAVIQLMQGDEVKYTATIAGDNYYVMNVAAGDYTVVATKSGHITVEYDITVGSKPVRQDVMLKYVAESTITGTTQSVRLIEPWAIRSYIQYAEDANSTDPVYLTSILGYGAYGIIEHKTDGTAPTSWEDIIYNEKAIKFEKSFTEGDEKISHTSNAGHNRRYTVMFDFYDMLYTYRMAEQVYWVTFYEDAEGIHFTNVYHISMSELIDQIKAEADPSATEEAVLDDMKTLHQELIEYRGADANLGNTPYPQGVKLSESGIKFEDVNTGSWQFGRRRQIRLIEPWGFKVTLRFKEIATDTILDDPNATAADYGMIFYHDKIDRYVNNGMSLDAMLAQGDAMVFSKSLNNMIVDGDSVLAIYTKDIYTYQLDSELYCLPFIKIGNQYYFPQNAICWNLLEEMETIRDDTVNRVEKERDVLAAMVDLYYDITKHLGYNE